jgi:anti-sigma B factor antagonist
MSELNIQERRIGEVTVLDMDGNVRIGGSNVALEKAIKGLIAEGRNQVLLNLARVAYIDSSGLGELVSAHVALSKKGGKIKLLNLTTRLNELMTITKLSTVFDVFEDESKAVESFKILDAVGLPTPPPDGRSSITVQKRP